MLLEIRGHHFPGRDWEIDGAPCHNVHVGVQLRRDPSDLVPGDADTASWLVDVDLVDRDGAIDFRGPAVQGKRGERFVYLTWGDVTAHGTFRMFRRAKLMLDEVDAATLEAANEPGRRLVATVDLTDDRGGPRCARLRPPALALTVE
jgi:hypothetical protein